MYDKKSGKVYGEFATDRGITLDEAIEFARLGPFVRIDENGNTANYDDDPDYISADGDEVWYDDVDYELI